MSKRFSDLFSKLNIKRLRSDAAEPPRETPKRPRREMTAKQRGLVFFFSLGACAVAVVVAGVLSVLYNDAPQLLDLNGDPFRGDELILLDPYRRDENALIPGASYDRPIAVVHAGAEDILLRIRLEETMMGLRRDGEHQPMVTAIAYGEARDFDIPRTVSQQHALQLLIDNEFFERGTTWYEALEARLPARRLPGETNDGGRIMVFERRTLTPNDDPDMPDLSGLLPEDIERLGLFTASYDFMGFYFLPSEDGGPPLYQPLRLTPEQNPGEFRSPNITHLLFEYYEWGIIQMAVHRFGQPESPVSLQRGPALRPISEWNGFENSWFYDEDGWVYYGSPLPPGLMTPLLIESFSVPPESQLATAENRYRLSVRTQYAPMDADAVYMLWNNRVNLDGFGYNDVSNVAGSMIMNMLG